MTAAAPRKKAKGEAHMRAMRRGTRSGWRPLLPSRMISTPLGWSVRRDQRACASRGTLARRARPAAWRSAIDISPWNCPTEDGVGTAPGISVFLEDRLELLVDRFAGMRFFMALPKLPSIR